MGEIKKKKKILEKMFQVDLEITTKNFIIK